MTALSDPDRRRVLDLIEDRDRRTIARYLRSLPEPAKRTVEVVSTYEAYRQAVRSELPGARIVVDRFHLVRGAGQALDTVRRERQRGAKRRKLSARRSQRGSFRQELFRARHRLLRARERLTERQRRQLCELFEREPLVAEAWGLKEAFRSIYKARDRFEAERRLDHFLAACERSGLAPFEAFANGLRPWRAELLAYFDEAVSNGHAEGVRRRAMPSRR